MIAVVFGAFYVTKFIARNGSPNRKNDKIRLIAMQRLGKESSVAMVEIEQSVYILGVGSQHVELIDKLPITETTHLSIEEPAANRLDFAAILKRELGDRFRKLK